MKNTSTKILFFGNERLVSGLKHTDTPVLRGLIDHNYDIRAVISHHEQSRSRTQRELEIAQLAAEHDIPVHLPNRPTDILEQIAAYNAEIAVLVAYGRIIPQRVIDLFPKGIINIHPSLLPKYRGPTPIESSILDGDQETGVSIMQLTAGMDSGPVYGQTTLSLTGAETKFDIYNSLSHMGAELLFDLLPRIIGGSMTPVEQDNTKATYCQLLTKDSGKLNLSSLSATEAERQVRAYLGFPKSKLTIFGHDIIIMKAHTSQTQETRLDLKCQDGYLSIDELIAPSGRRMDAESFLRGYAANPTSL
jgi:methionyl-tRNA formyltransferase